uniref:Adenylyl-sulfate kinase n=1 Tax=uncultured Flavobacteriia bacterium TaxID=212695 RepID=F4MMC2_9BACT|nr:adenylylsulfate kinase [uncultured bacterium]CBL87263.1 qdenylyl-sulfate kinase [uncultured Flavobacteriia bacterium]
MQENIFPIKDTLLQQAGKEKLNGHKGLVLWMFGLSGSGKSTIARALENDLYLRGIHSKLLDGDNLRSGINNNLSFSIEDRTENIRRAAEVSKLFMENGDVVICSLVSPTIEIREQARLIIGEENFKEVYVNAPFDVCASRDVKGLYKKALAGEIKNFTGLDSPFEGAENPFVELKTDEKDLDTCKNELVELVLKEIQL